MKKLILIAFAAFGFNAAIAQSSLDRASGGYFNNNQPTPAPAGSHTVAADSQNVASTDNQPKTKVSKKTNPPSQKKSANREATKSATNPKNEQ